MIGVVLDTSVLLKWFHSQGEAEVAESRAIRDAHVSEVLEVITLELSRYELGNILIRSLKWNAQATADQLDDLQDICGGGVVPTKAAIHDAAELSASLGLTFYDSLFAAVARDLGTPFVSADRQLLEAGLAVSATDFANELSNLT